MASTLSVVIPTLNDSTLPRTLQAVMEQTRAADEIIVVGRDENGVAGRFPRVRFVDTGKPVCAAVARNCGIAESRGQIIVFTDADCIPETDWLEQHERAHCQGARVAGGGVSVASENYWVLSDNVSMFHDFVRELPPGERSLLPTLNLSVQRSVVEEVGLMDESFPGAAAEDSDWTIRMRLAGYRLQFVPAAVVHHAPSRTRWKDVVGHWRKSGFSGIRVRHRYAQDYATPAFARSALMLRLLSPFIAARVTAGIYSDLVFWPYWRCLPVIYLTKIIYCLGAAAAIDNGFAFDTQRVGSQGSGPGLAL
ncbi:MAG: glycosyltransferase [Haliea sp.]|uniref:glycosyltransferase family 2 protein n=1 Tax=Haliea sp. TaxID=1932666 RepID=UPI0032EBBFE9